MSLLVLRGGSGRVLGASSRGVASHRATAYLFLALGACTSPEPPPRESGRPVAPPPVFTELGEASGLEFVHDNGGRGAYHMPEIMGSGVALLDYDDDGDLDVYLVQSGPIGSAADPDATDRLYRTDLSLGADGTGEMRFVDVTAEAGIDATGYGMGAATGDYDNDGDVDLYVTNWGPNQLWRNEGDGTFTEVARVSGADDDRWSVPAVFFDYDLDGHLDLFVGNYLDFDLDVVRPCRRVTGARDYCDPAVYDSVPDRLLRNRGDGTFEDVTRQAGLDAAWGKALGAVAADLDADGRLDLYVANDRTTNQLWMNRPDGRFQEVGLPAGAAVNEVGNVEGSMGVTAGDYDGDGDLDLFMTHFEAETNTLYANDGTGGFTDITRAALLAVPSFASTGFGTAWFDYDGDGWMDLFVANGAVRAIEALVQAGDPFPFHQPNQLFRNRGDGRFEETTEAAGAPLARSEVSRGAAFGDLDNDGDPDVVVTNNGGAARVLRNDTGSGGEWIGLRLVTGDPGRDALGARVEVQAGAFPSRWWRVRTDGSYASANDPRILARWPASEGGGARPSVTVRVHWLVGGVETWSGLEPGRYVTLRRGTGTRGGGLP